MRILFVIEYYPPHIGGVEIAFRNLCEGLVSKGHEATVITSKLKDTKEFEIINNVKIYRVKVPKKGDRYWFTFLSIPKVYALTGEVELIHTTTYNGAPPAWLISKLRGKKCIITVHEIFGSLWKDLVGMNWFSAKLHQFLERFIIFLPFDKYVCVSRHTFNSLKAVGIREKKIDVIYNAIDYNLFDPSKANGEEIRKKLRLRNEFIYMYYGRPGVSKGVEYLIQSVPFISERISNSKLLLLLANDPKDRYENIKMMINDLRIEDRVILLDPVPRSELPHYIAASDCVVVPSLSEGFGFTAVEACAMEKSVVASDVASLPEVVSGKYVLVEPRNPEAIAVGVEMVYKDKVKDRGKKIFSWDEHVQKYLQHYVELLKE